MLAAGRLFNSQTQVFKLILMGENVLLYVVLFCRFILFGDLQERNPNIIRQHPVLI